MKLVDLRRVADEVTYQSASGNLHFLTPV